MRVLVCPYQGMYGRTLERYTL
eukprot:SAG31_NODE_35696_length_320_cov_1.407240_1_plen_21_part_10